MIQKSFIKVMNVDKKKSIVILLLKDTPRKTNKKKKKIAKNDKTKTNTKIEKRSY